MARNILILGASYGSLLATKLLMAGHNVTLVCRTGVLPQINTGMAGKVAGVGQVGAGLVNPPAEIFPKALAALAERARRRVAL